MSTLCCTVADTHTHQGTGVINDLPPRHGDTLPASQSTPSGPPQGLGIHKDTGKTAEQDSWSKIAEERESGKAAELALREVLGSIEAARYLPSRCHRTPTVTCLANPFRLAGPVPRNPTFSTLTSSA